MQKFAGHKTLAEIKQQCEALGVPLNTSLYDRYGYDTVGVGTNGNSGGWVIYNVVSGRFFGRTPGGVNFTSDNSFHDHEPWMEMLLKFFHKDPV